MARNRQRAKDRQAARRAARLADRQPTGTPDAQATAEPAEALPPKPAAGDEADLLRMEAAAPPEDTGRSDTVLQSPDDAAELPTGPVTVEDRAERPQRGRVAGFLAGSWAELQRVQWPDRAALTSLTGIVLAFVLLAGGYLGLLDAVFSKLIHVIL